MPLYSDNDNVHMPLYSDNDNVHMSSDDVNRRIII